VLWSDASGRVVQVADGTVHVEELVGVKWRLSLSKSSAYGSLVLCVVDLQARLEQALASSWPEQENRAPAGDLEAGGEVGS